MPSLSYTRSDGSVVRQTDAGLQIDQFDNDSTVTGYETATLTGADGWNNMTATFTLTGGVVQMTCDSSTSVTATGLTAVWTGIPVAYRPPAATDIGMQHITINTANSSAGGLSVSAGGALTVRPILGAVYAAANFFPFSQDQWVASWTI